MYVYACIIVYVCIRIFMYIYVCICMYMHLYVCLSLNRSKTQLIWLGTRQQLLKLDFALLAAQFPQFTLLTSVRDLGVTLDNLLSFSAHISNVSRSSFYHLRRVRAARRSSVAR